jgi:hypothetical protein
MADVRDIPVGTLDAAQAAELALLVDLEARWENLRTTTSRPADVQPTTQELHGKQKAYEAFRAKLAVYNKRFKPSHIPELLLNTPLRLGIWCRTMRDLYGRVEQAAQMQPPVHLVEKAHRWAERVAARIGAQPPARTAPSVTIREAIERLEGLNQWCANLASAPPKVDQPLVA